MPMVSNCSATRDLTLIIKIHHINVSKYMTLPMRQQSKQQELTDSLLLVGIQAREDNDFKPRWIEIRLVRNFCFATTAFHGKS